MFYTGPKIIKLAARNEGKLKSYESCADVRAWSHDCERRGLYLRDWMKSNMPICFIPASTLSIVLKTMTLKSRGKVTPRCHSECKSKALLESICTSCHAIKNVLKKEEQFEKYFIEEEFETSHWPCERCLEALKSIKMFWKIITERIFNILVPTNNELYSTCSSQVENIRNVAKAWEDEIVHQAFYVKKSTELILKPTKSLNNLTIKCIRNAHKSFDNECNKSNKKVNSKDQAIETNSKKRIKSSMSSMKPLNNINKCTSVRLKTVDIGCNKTCDDEEDINMYKTDLEHLQQRYNSQKDELGRLKKENILLNLKIQNKSKTCLSPSWYFRNNNRIPEDIDSLPRPFEEYCEEEMVSAKDVQSEIIITLKNCKNEDRSKKPFYRLKATLLRSGIGYFFPGVRKIITILGRGRKIAIQDYEHVSLLQVLHKTNTAILNDNENDQCFCNKEKDPIEMLARVQDKFEKIVKREMNIATENKIGAKETDIDVSYKKIRDVRPIPSRAKTNTTSTSKY